MLYHKSVNIRTVFTSLMKYQRLFTNLKSFLYEFCVRNLLFKAGVSKISIFNKLLDDHIQTTYSSLRKLF